MIYNRLSNLGKSCFSLNTILYKYMYSVNVHVHVHVYIVYCDDVDCKLGCVQEFRKYLIAYELIIPHTHTTGHKISCHQTLTEAAGECLSPDVKQRSLALPSVSRKRNTYTHVHVHVHLYKYVGVVTLFIRGETPFALHKL